MVQRNLLVSTFWETPCLISFCGIFYASIPIVSGQTNLQGRQNSETPRPNPQPSRPKPLLDPGWLDPHVSSILFGGTMGPNIE